MNRTTQYLTSHPEQTKLFNIINSVKNSSHVSITIATGSPPNCLLFNQLENPIIDIAYFTVNNIDEAILFIKGRKFYSFNISDMKIFCIESEAKTDGINHRLKFLNLGEEYHLNFFVPTVPTRNVA